MKPCLFLLVITLVLSCFAGCQQPEISQPACNVEVIIEGDSGEGFPEELVGKWRASQGSWEIVFEPDGSISSLIHTIGGVKMYPCQVSEVPLRKDGKAFYKPGKWTVQYDHENRELGVDIELANYQYLIGTTTVEGSSKDFFAGTVSEDFTRWEANWVSLPKYIATTDEYDHYELPIPIAMQERGSIVFRKVEAKK